MAELAMEDPSIQKVTDNEGNPSRELAFSFYILWICSHAHAMRKRKVLDDSGTRNMETSRARQMV
jgi:hypothetical protein